MSDADGFPTEPGDIAIRAMTSGDVHGHFCWFTCPRNPEQTCGVPIKPLSSPPFNTGWEWDGNTAAPTLTPSVNCIAEHDGKPTGGCGWHGFVRAGKLEGA